MTADQALEELLDVSEDIGAAVLFDRDGEILAASLGDETARTIAGVAGAMLSYAEALRSEAGVARLEALTDEGGVFVLREGDRAAVAVTGTDPVAGLVYHDLRACLRNCARPTREKARATS